MFEPPRQRSEPILPFFRLAKTAAYGITMLIGTLAVLYYGMQTGTELRAKTLAFTTFVLFQVFNVFNARNENDTAFNAHFFNNRMLWGSIVGVLALQFIAVHWSTANALFSTGGMTFADWSIATGVAASILLLEEARKLGAKLFAKFH